MDEDEDVDILGDLDDISKISSGQLLSCEYTVHPNWLNENSEGGSFWTNSVPKNCSLENNIKLLQSEEVTIKVPELVPSLVDLDWNKEISLENDLVFEDDIPVTVEEIVDGNNSTGTFSSISEYNRKENHSNDEWDLAPLEVYPASKNLKYIGPTNPRSVLKVKIESSESQLNDKLTTSGIHEEIHIKKPKKKFKKTLRLKSDFLKKPEYSKLFPTSKKVPDNKYTQNDGKKFKTTLNIPAVALRKDTNLSGIIKSSGFRDGKIRSKTKNTSINITRHKKPLFWPETVVKLETCESDGDIEIEIETDMCNERKCKVEENKNVALYEQHIGNLSEDDILNKKENLKNNLSCEIEKQLKDINVPQTETNLNPADITSLEKYVHSEFFENRITKTPEQYSRIRNHIIFMWQTRKPSYISKTAVRAGLKHAGDVNCISRIHKLLEQLGVINFGHQGKHFEFIRPLELFVSTLVQSPRNQMKATLSKEDFGRMERRKRVPPHLKTIDETIKSEIFLINSLFFRKCGTRLWRKIIKNVDQKIYRESHDVNYTVTHIEGVFKPELSSTNTSRHKIRRMKTEVDLVKCLKFPKEAPFKVAINLSTLLCLHLHSLSSKYEVMGFLGGHRSISAGREKLHLTNYKPCRTSQQSVVMCEMCPVSQVKQSVRLLSEGHELLGWFHSHPTFPANPSRTDVETQKEMQLQFSLDNNRPLVGVILSCVNMTLRCIYLMPKDLHSDVRSYGLPHEIDVDVVKDFTELQNDIKEILSIIQNYKTFGEIIKKFKLTSRNVLQQYSLEENIVFNEILPK